MAISSTSLETIELLRFFIFFATYDVSHITTARAATTGFAFVLATSSFFYGDCQKARARGRLIIQYRYDDLHHMIIRLRSLEEIGYENTNLELLGKKADQ